MGAALAASAFGLLLAVGSSAFAGERDAGQADREPLMEEIVLQGGRQRDAQPAQASTSATHDQDEAALPARADEARFEAVLRAGAWLARPGGDFSLDGPGGAGRTFTLNGGLGLDDLEPSFNGELELTFDDRWLARVSGFDYAGSATDFIRQSGRFGDLTLAAGDRIRSELEMRSVAIEFGWDAFELGQGFGSAKSLEPDGENEARAAFRPVVGARWVEVEQSIANRDTAQRQEVAADWFALTAGLEFHVDWEPRDGLLLGEALRLEAGGALGPAVTNDMGFVWQVRAGLTWEAIHGAELMFGYRLLELDVEDGGYDFGGGLQGLFVGGTIRF